jgi:hypothetical protein
MQIIGDGTFWNVIYNDSGLVFLIGIANEILIELLGRSRKHGYREASTSQWAVPGYRGLISQNICMTGVSLSTVKGVHL